MSRKTVEFLRKIAQQKQNGGTSRPEALLPDSRVKSTGRMQIVVGPRNLDGEEEQTSVFRRAPGQKGGDCTEAMGVDKRMRLLKLAK